MGTRFAGFCPLSREGLINQFTRRRTVSVFLIWEELARPAGVPETITFTECCVSPLAVGIDVQRNTRTSKTAIARKGRNAVSVLRDIFISFKRSWHILWPPFFSSQEFFHSKERRRFFYVSGPPKFLILAPLACPVQKRGARHKHPSCENKICILLPAVRGQTNDLSVSSILA
jgi:hypothetical protein